MKRKISNLNNTVNSRRIVTPRERYSTTTIELNRKKKKTVKKKLVIKQKTVSSNNTQSGTKGIGRIILILAVAAFGYNYARKTEYIVDLKTRWNKGASVVQELKVNSKIIESAKLNKKEEKKDLIILKQKTIKNKKVITKKEINFAIGKPIALIAAGDIYSIDINGVIGKTNNKQNLDLPFLNSKFKRKVLPGRKYDNLIKLLNFINMVKMDRIDLYINISEIWNLGDKIGLKFRNHNFKILIPLNSKDEIVEEIGIMKDLIDRDKKGIIDMSFDKMAILKEEARWVVE